MPIHDGSFEVAKSIATASGGKVTVKTGAGSFETAPSNLFELTFDDPDVGIDDDHMRDFKTALKTLLPSIGATIDQIPEDSSKSIDDVAEIVRVALVAAGK